MNELELLIELKKLLNSRDKFNYSEPPDSQTVIELDLKIKSIILNLKKIENKEFSRNALQYISLQIKAYINELRQSNQHFLDRDQGTLTKNRLILNIISDLSVFVQGEIFGITIPANLKYLDKESRESIDKQKLIDFLDEQNRKLCESEKDFHELLDYLDKFKQSIFYEFKT